MIVGTIILEEILRYYELKNIPTPTLQNWANRLREYIDLQYMDIAVKRFYYLVDHGFTPDTAFDIVKRG